MCNMLGKNLLPASSGMDTNHSDTNRPRSISNGHLQVRIIRLKERLRNQKDKKTYWLKSLFQVLHSPSWHTFSLPLDENIVFHYSNQDIQAWGDLLPCPEIQTPVEREANAKHARKTNNPFKPLCSGKQCISDWISR